MSIKDYIKETKKKEIGFYINGEKSINEYIRKLKHFLKTYEKASIISISGKVDVTFVEEDILDDGTDFVHWIYRCTK